MICFKCRDKGHYAYECPKKKENVNEVEESETEIALTVCKVPSEEEAPTCSTCVDYNNQEYSNHIHCTEESQGNIELKCQEYVKFYDNH